MKRTIAGILGAIMGLMALGFFPWVIGWIITAMTDNYKSERALGRLNAPVCAAVVIVTSIAAFRWLRYAIGGPRKKN